jgi:hypothetical protein
VQPIFPDEPGGKIRMPEITGRWEFIALDQGNHAYLSIVSLRFNPAIN